MNIQVVKDSKLAHIILKNELRTTSIEWFETFILHQKFCDANGNLFQLEQLTPLKKDWKLSTLLSNKFKPGMVYNYEFKAIHTQIKLSDFKLTCKEFVKHIFVEKAQKENVDTINSATSHKEAMDCLTIIF